VKQYVILLKTHCLLCCNQIIGVFCLGPPSLQHLARAAVQTASFGKTVTYADIEAWETDGLDVPDAMKAYLKYN
jgi:hypothetical protein